ncbi:MAG: hypothetical protein GX774_20875 [Armatimonadetes bacterium]|jgi:hypothetical protein|nr:hypothetical protein [Armatimonadota bacterium]
MEEVTEQKYEKITEQEQAALAGRPQESAPGEQNRSVAPGLPRRREGRDAGRLW